MHPDSTQLTSRGVPLFTGPPCDLSGYVRDPPSAQSQSPFARARCSLSRRGWLLHVSGRSPAFLAHTGSCASPTLSHRLWSLPRSAGLCRSLSAPAGNRTFPTFALRIFPSVPGPLPRQLWWCTCPFLPTRLRPSRREDPVGASQHPYGTFSMDFIAGLQSFTHVQAHRVARHPDCSSRGTFRRRAAVAFTFPPLSVRDLPEQGICSPSVSGN